MAARFSLMPLRSIPNLIPACVRLLKDEWPHCKAELLPKIVEMETAGIPCSLGVVEHPDDAHSVGTLVGHVRLISVLDRPGAAFIESLCVDRAKRGIGLGSETIRLTEEFARKMAYRELHAQTTDVWSSFMQRSLYTLCKKPPVVTVGANVLRSFDKAASWHGNILYPGLESEYEGGYVATEEEVADGFCDLWYMKHLNGSTPQDE